MKKLSIILIFLAGMAQAGPDNSKRPTPRPEPHKGPVMMAEMDESVVIERRERRAQSREKAGGENGLGFSLRPFLRSRKVQKAAREQKQMREKGAVCGDIAIQGEAIGHVAGKINGCGVENAVRVRSVSGVSLSQKSVMDCGTAKALKSWLDRTAKPALAGRGGGLTQLQVAAHYACRRRNNASSGKVSEHGKGRAIDLSAFVLKDGTSISVLQGWNARRHSKPLRAMHQGACGPFGTVLGPNADRYHTDHFHFDTARYRKGKYCR